MDGGVGAIILISDTLYSPYTHFYKFSSRFSIRLLIYGLHKICVSKIYGEAIILICERVS